VFFEALAVPAHVGLQWASRAAARRCPKGDIRLAFCRMCGCVANTAFDPALVQYGEAYDNSLFHSPRFRDYSRSLAERLVDHFGLHDKHVTEIGCGKGEFLRMLCALGNNQGTGFDPSYEPDRVMEDIDHRITVVRDFFSGQLLRSEEDLVACRFTFEHLSDPGGLLTTLRGAVGDNTRTGVFFEVPNALSIFRDGVIWDIIYEHCSYFSSESLAHVFVTHGFEVRDLSEAFGGQFLSLEAAPAAGPTWTAGAFPGEFPETARHVAGFAQTYQRKMDNWREKLGRMAQTGRRAVVWGAGAKGVSFLNSLRIHDQIEYAVDINPGKQGKHVAGTGQMIVPPGFLSQYRPDLVIVMNPLYEAEIQATLRDLGLATETVCA